MQVASKPPKISKAEQQAKRAKYLEMVARFPSTPPPCASPTPSAFSYDATIPTLELLPDDFFKTSARYSEPRPLSDVASSSKHTAQPELLLNAFSSKRKANDEAEPDEKCETVPRSPLHSRNLNIDHNLFAPTHSTPPTKFPIRSSSSIPQPHRPANISSPFPFDSSPQDLRDTTPSFQELSLQEPEPAPVFSQEDYIWLSTLPGFNPPVNG
ncbi:hypothetical protein FB451DRAFT_1388617 [Mycena latifolia]|nr:hypothetical protein FB451DRAFT_1388617 [Mycena latifolia]